MSIEQLIDEIFEFLGLEGPFSAASRKKKKKLASSKISNKDKNKEEGKSSSKKKVVHEDKKGSTVKKVRKIVNFTKATEEQISDLLLYRGKILTGDSGMYAISDKAKGICAVLEDGTVLLVEGNKMSPVYSNLKKRMAAKEQIITRRLYVDEEALHKIYLNYDRIILAEKELSTTDSAQMKKDFFELVQRATDEKASDIHILNQRHEAIVRIRADGVMQDLTEFTPTYASEFMSAIFYMSDVSDSSYRPLDYQGARISSGSTLPEEIQSIRLQFNPLPNGGRQMVARLLYSQSTNKNNSNNEDIDALGYGKIHVKDMKVMRKKPFGIVVISGPTGSGKSTTLQKALTALMKEKRHQINVLTIEDPPEYVIDGAAQIPVTNADTEEERSKKFTAAISAALRSDPDVIMIGEIRDKASSALAFAASMTGHQVWASLHANDAVSVLDRFKDQEVEDYKLCDPTLVTGLVGQRLMRRLCDVCKVPLNAAIAYEDDRVLDPLMMDSLQIKIGKEHYSKIYVASESGCDKCRKGYVGRTVVAETIVPDRAFMQFMQSGDKVGAIEHWKKNLNGMAILEHAVIKMLKGEVDPREVEGKVEPISLFDKSRMEFCLEQSLEELSDAELAKSSSEIKTKMLNILVDNKDGTGNDKI
jgi:general secretion pathway protein E